MPRLEAVLTAYAAAVSHRREHGTDLAVLLHPAIRSPPPTSTWSSS